VDSVALQDVIMRKGVPITSVSKILNGFKPLITATVAEKLLENNYQIVETTKVDDFGIIFFSENESLGALDAVESGAAEFALCNDIFGSYRANAPKKNCAYIHPTYGTVSRYGLIPVASSMDQIGVLCKDLRRGFELLSKISGNDSKDGAMLPEREKISCAQKKIRVGVCEKFSNDAIISFANQFEKINIELKYSNVYAQVLQILASAEFSANISRYDGIKFGNRAADFRGIDELYKKTRTEGFGLGAKAAAILGGFVLSQNNYELYYEKAMKIRRLIKESLLFDEYDVIALPCEINLAVLAGLPAVSFSHEGNGIQLVANVCCEHDLIF
jgi:aspartyl-tRNA(Asn)/glutamyl-tRNA(Gln) amidotransferase subunit A